MMQAVRRSVNRDVRRRAVRGRAGERARHDPARHAAATEIRVQDLAREWARGLPIPELATA